MRCLQSLQHAVHHLGASAEYQAVLREEIEPIIQEYGWTKSAMARMWKLDSFMKESQRMNGLNAGSLFSSAPVSMLLSA